MNRIHALSCSFSWVTPQMIVAVMTLQMAAMPNVSAQVQSGVASGTTQGSQSFTLPDGRRYTGEMRNGRINGRGVYEWPEDRPWIRYEGELVEGALHRGVLTYRNGDSYEGDFAQGQRWGKGTMVFLGGTRYEGDFVAGQMSGKGVYSFYWNLKPTGERYEGEFLNGRRNGYAKSIASNRIAFEGGFIDGQRAGPGVTNPGSAGSWQEKGDYLNGKAEGPGELKVPGRPPVAGIFKNGGFTPLVLWPKGQAVPARSAEAQQAEDEVKRRSALAQQHSRDAQAMHLATAEERRQVARTVLAQQAAANAQSTVTAAPLAVASAAPAQSPGLAIKVNEEAKARAECEKAMWRVQDLGNGSLQQVCTGLFWTQFDNGNDISWAEARAHCSSVGPTWSLPTIAQLKSLIGTPNPNIQCGVEGEWDECNVSDRFSLSGPTFWSSEASRSVDGTLVYLTNGDRASASYSGMRQRFRALCVSTTRAEVTVRRSRPAQQERENHASSTPAVNPLAAGIASGLASTLSTFEKMNRTHNDAMNQVQIALAERERREQEQRQIQSAARVEREREQLAEQRAEIERQRLATAARAAQVAQAPGLPTAATPVPRPSDASSRDSELLAQIKAQLPAAQANQFQAQVDALGQRKTNAPAAAVVPIPTPASSKSPSTSPPSKKIEWGPIVDELIAVCRQSTRTGKWTCNGGLDNQIMVDETLEAALERQHCLPSTWSPGGVMIEGVKWEIYRCRRGSGAGDYDVAKRYGLSTPRSRYICPKYQSQRCTNIYDGQDLRE